VATGFMPIQVAEASIGISEKMARYAKLGEST